MKNKRVIFAISVSNAIDIITNSSSELFVLQGKTKEIVKEMIRDVYPEYLTEYEELLAFRDMDADQLDSYLSYHYDSWSNNAQKRINGVVPGFTFEQMYEIPDWAKNRDARDKREPEYYIKNDFAKENLEEIKKAIDPNGTMYMLYSIEDHPNWDMVELLEQIGSRYHLG